MIENVSLILLLNITHKKNAGKIRPPGAFDNLLLSFASAHGSSPLQWRAGLQHAFVPQGVDELAPYSAHHTSSSSLHPLIAAPLVSFLIPGAAGGQIWKNALSFSQQEEQYHLPAHLFF